MSRIAYVNGRFVPHSEAQVHVEDRGYQFSDGVYEVTAVLRAKAQDLEPHLDRLERSLAELSIAMPASRRTIAMLHDEMIRRNLIRDGMVYLQVTRGVSARDHAFPGRPVRPALVMTAKRLDFARIAATAAQGVAVVTQPDIRWGRCDIKTVSLLANVLAKQAARAAGAFECWMVDRDGFITEGSSSNAWIVDSAGRLRTRSLSQSILPGITRQVLFAEAARAGIEIVEQPFTVDEVLSAREAFTTSTTAFVMPVVRLDGKAVGEGRPGEMTLRLRRIYDAHMSLAD